MRSVEKMSFLRKSYIVRYALGTGLVLPIVCLDIAKLYRNKNKGRDKSTELIMRFL